MKPWPAPAATIRGGWPADAREARIAGGYGTGSIQLGRFAIADDANEAVAFSGISVVPGSGGAMLAMVAASCVGGRRRRTA